MTIEDRLRGALAPQDPGPDFVSGVMGRVRQAPRRKGPPWYVPLALAATVAMVAVGVHWRQEQQRTELASAQLELALQITSFELTQVQRKLDRTAIKENGS